MFSLALLLLSKRFTHTHTRVCFRRLPLADSSMLASPFFLFLRFVEHNIHVDLSTHAHVICLYPVCMSVWVVYYEACSSASHCLDHDSETIHLCNYTVSFYLFHSTVYSGFVVLSGDGVFFIYGGSVTSCDICVFWRKSVRGTHMVDFLMLDFIEIFPRMFLRYEWEVTSTCVIPQWKTILRISSY